MNVVIRFIAVALAVPLVLSACATDEYGNRRPLTDAEKGALIGAAGGAVLGAATGKPKDRSQRAIIGAVGGGIAGGLVGNYMDKQKQDLEKILAPEVSAGAIQIEKMPENALRVTMTDRTAFEVDSSQIQTGFYSTLDKLANILVRYGKTELLIVGHTDSTGSDQYNQGLSERRALSVESYLSQHGVISQRMSSYGKGESQPRASNATVSGRQLNRRVEVIVVPLVERS